MFVHIYTYTYISLHIHIYTCTHICIPIHTYIYIYIFLGSVPGGTRAGTRAGQDPAGWDPGQTVATSCLLLRQLPHSTSGSRECFLSPPHAGWRGCAGSNSNSSSNISIYIYIERYVAYCIHACLLITYSDIY